MTHLIPPIKSPLKLAIMFGPYDLLFYPIISKCDFFIVISLLVFLNIEDYVEDVEL